MVRGIPELRGSSALRPYGYTTFWTAIINPQLVRMGACIFATSAGIRQFAPEGCRLAAACLQAADLREEGRPLELSLHGWASDTGCTDEDVDGGTDEDAEGLVAASGRHAAPCGSHPGGAPGGGAPLQTGEPSQPQELSLRDWQGDQSRTPPPAPGSRSVRGHCIEQLYGIRCTFHSCAPYQTQFLEQYSMLLRLMYISISCRFTFELVCIALSPGAYTNSQHAASPLSCSLGP